MLISTHKLDTKSIKPRSIEFNRRALNFYKLKIICESWVGIG